MAILKKLDTAEGASDKNLFYRGELSETTVSSLLLDALEEGLSGTLTLSLETERKVIHLLQGRLVHVRSSQSRETLGQMLANKGLIDPVEYSAALRHSREHGIPYSEALIKLGLMESERVVEEMTDAVRRRVEACLSWRSGSWMFIGAEEVSDQVPQHPLDTVDLVFNGLKRHFREEAALAALADKKGKKLELLPRCITYRELFVTSFGSSLLEATAAGYSISELLKTPKPGHAALQITVLLHTGMARVRGQVAPPVDSVDDLREELQTRHARASTQSRVGAAAARIFDPTETDGPFLEDEPTPIVDPPEIDEPLFGDEPTPIVDPPEIDEPLFVDEPTPIVDPPYLDQAPRPGQGEGRGKASRTADSIADRLEPAPPPEADEDARVPASRPVAGRYPGWLVPLGTFLLGAATASAFFMLYSPHKTGTAGPPAEVSPRSTTPVKVTLRARPWAGKEATPLDAGSTSVTPDSGARASAEARSTTAEAGPGAGQAPTAPPPGDQPPAMAAGLAVAAAVRPCLGDNPTATHLIAARLSAGGRVNRVFVARLRGSTRAEVRCIRQKLKGTTLPLKLRKAGYMEWRIRFKTDPPSVKVRPRYLRNVVGGGKKEG